MGMTWLLMWLNVSVATLNATLQLLVIFQYFKISKIYFKIKLKIQKRRWG